jgi:hypothetical protein
MADENDSDELDSVRSILVMSGDDMEDLLSAIDLYEDELMYSGEDSLYTADILNNLSSLRQRIAGACRERLH